MSLVKSYRLSCEGPELARRLGAPFLNAHVTKTVVAYDSAAKARRMAAKSGWTRVTKQLPILVSHPSAGSVDVKFDLCPVCSVSLAMTELNR